MNPFLLLPFIVLGIILAILAFVLKKKHSAFPDFKVGYHDKRVMENKEKWDYANNLAGNLCAGFAVAFFVLLALLYLFKAGTAAALLILFVLSVIAIGSILFLPIVLSKRIR